MAAPRATKTRLAFGLVACDIALYKTSQEEKAPTWDKAGPNGGELLPATTTDEIAQATTAALTPSDPLADNPAEAFAEIAGSEDPPEPVVAIEQNTRQELFKDDIRRGIRNEDGTFTDLTDGLEQIAEATKLDEMRVADFIRTEEIRRDRIVGSYFLAPGDAAAAKVVRLMHEAMRLEHRVAVVKWTKKSKQSLGVLVPHPESKSLMVIELAWAEDMRAVPEKVMLPRQVTVTDEEVGVARDLVVAMHSTRAEALDSLTDDARRLRAELVESGGTVLVPEHPEVEQGADVIDLMTRGLRDRDALKRSAA